MISSYGQLVKTKIIPAIAAGIIATLFMGGAASAHTMDNNNYDPSHKECEKNWSQSQQNQWDKDKKCDPCVKETSHKKDGKWTNEQHQNWMASHKDDWRHKKDNDCKKDDNKDKQVNHKNDYDPHKQAYTASYKKVIYKPVMKKVVKKDYNKYAHMHVNYC